MPTLREIAVGLAAVVIARARAAIRGVAFAMLIVLGALVDEANVLDVIGSIGCGHAKGTRASFFHMNHAIVKQGIQKVCLYLGNFQMPIQCAKKHMSTAVPS